MGLGSAAPDWIDTGPAAAPFDFAAAVARLVADIARKTPDFAHLDASRMLFGFVQARTPRGHGLLARVAPLRFRGGAAVRTHRGRDYRVQTFLRDGREILYVVSFCLPRFFERAFEDKLVTVFHELYHVAPAFDGDLRRHPGRYSVHTRSQKDYDRLMARLAADYLRAEADPRASGFLRAVVRPVAPPARAGNGPGVAPAESRPGMTPRSPPRRRYNCVDSRAVPIRDAVSLPPPTPTTEADGGERLRRAEHVVAALDKGVAVLRADWTVAWCNAAFHAWCDGDPVGRPFLAALGSPEPDDFDATRRAAVAGVPVCVRLHPGRSRHLDVTVTPVRAGDEVVELVALCDDVTAAVVRRQKLDALHRAGQELDALDADHLTEMDVPCRVELLKQNVRRHVHDLLHYDVIEIRLLDRATNATRAAAGRRHDGRGGDARASRQSRGERRHRLRGGGRPELPVPRHRP